MDCKEAEGLIPKYLDDSMDRDTLLEFMMHIRDCKTCYNELETYYIVEKAMETLETEDDPSFDLSKVLEKDLNRRWTMLSRLENNVHITIFFAVLTALCMIWIFLDMYGIFSLSYLL
ncbi:MAG: zf-HC2 domain-containing protein [Lachnospiraceae bacterium]|nr:zf-HC2 domain-containing protein [Lachnospiraceae bacterium]